jgi:septal ring factor EnvC (AmiA/AmiB activator)
MDVPTLRHIAYGFLVAVILAAAIVVTTTQYQRAEDASSLAESNGRALGDTQAELAEVNANFTATSAALSAVRTELTTTSQTLDTASRQRDTLSSRASACRYVVRVNDRLLRGLSLQQNATEHLLNGREKGARRATRRVAWQVRAIQRLVRRSGHRSISGLVNACAPSRAVAARR